MAVMVEVVVVVLVIKVVVWLGAAMIVTVVHLGCGSKQSDKSLGYIHIESKIVEMLSFPLHIHALSASDPSLEEASDEAASEVRPGGLVCLIYSPLINKWLWQ